MSNCEHTIALLTRQIEILILQQHTQGSQLYQLYLDVHRREIAELENTILKLREQIRTLEQNITLKRLEF